MTVKISKYNSRLRHATLILLDGIEFWDKVRLPDLPQSTGDIFHTVEDGERLDSIARRYYKKEEYRWVIAHANNLGLMASDVIVGAKLRIPDPSVVRKKLLL